jgi:hypothetical protein
MVVPSLEIAFLFSAIFFISIFDPDDKIRIIAITTATRANTATNNFFTSVGLNRPDEGDEAI